MINWITPNVAVGEYLDVNMELIEKEQIDCVLSLRVLEDYGEFTRLKQMGVKYFKIPVGRRHQGSQSIKIELRAAAYILEELTDKYSKILVHCTAGIDRAPFVVAYWLANKEYYTLHNIKDQMIEAYKDVKRKRPQIMEHMEWI